MDSRNDFNVVIAYEDLPTGKCAKETCDWLSKRLGDDSEFTCNLWRFDVLADPGLKRAAVRDAEAARMIIIAFRGEMDLSTDAKIWIELWLQEKPKRPRILLALSDRANAGTQNMASIHRYLRTVAKRGRMELFTQEANMEDGDLVSYRGEMSLTCQPSV